jgi:hypothetical protein
VEVFYTVDRVGNLSDGLEISLTKHEDIRPPELSLHVNKLYPDGVSAHGERYLLQSESRGNIASPAIELLFEYVRQSYFPDKPSRFQSFYACASVAEAQEFKRLYGSANNSIWEVKTDNNYFSGNMRLLDNNQTSLVCSYISHEYWNGNKGPKELHGIQELLLELPVTIGSKIE